MTEYEDSLFEESASPATGVASTSSVTSAPAWGIAVSWTLAVSVAPGAIDGAQAAAGPGDPACAYPTREVDPIV